MPVSEDLRGQNSFDFKQKYRNLKRKLKLLIYENECYNEELRKAQRQLLQVTRDKNFLLDKLLVYENLNSTTSDSDATDSSDSENAQNKTENETKKRKTSEQNRSPSASPNLASSSTSKKKKTPTTSTVSRVKNINSQTTISTPVCKPNTRNLAATPAVKTPIVSQMVTNIPLPSLNSEAISVQTKQSSLLSVANNDGQLTSEEIERHFESRPLQPSLLMPEKTPLTVPVELFSNESSTGLSEERV